jgi:hypothetical protein
MQRDRTGETEMPDWMRWTMFIGGMLLLGVAWMRLIRRSQSDRSYRNDGDAHETIPGEHSASDHP